MDRILFFFGMCAISFLYGVRFRHDLGPLRDELSDELYGRPNSGASS